MGEPRKEYILHFYDGRVRREFGRLSDFQKLPVSRIEEAPPAYRPGFQREMEQILNPLSMVKRDVERVNQALGEGFTQLQDVFGPQALEARLKALHPDMPIQKVNEVVGKVVEILQPNLDGLWRRRQ
ncbi:MAG: hypothetical protein Q8O76_14745 [Chloroflexota bacterium]|nr:hypothetical protein [Chloroflexota bacterium]